MDVARTPFILIIAAILADSAIAAPQSSTTPTGHTVNYTGENAWSSAGPATSATIGAAPTDRYGNPISVTQRATNAVTETTNSLRDGFNAGANSASQQVQSWSNAASQQFQTAGNNIRTTAQQTVGNVGYPSQSTNPFATQPPAAPAGSARSASTSPWTTGSTAPAATTAPSWTSNSVPATPVDRSVLANPQAAQPSGGWTSIGSSIAAPPLLAPPLPSSGSSLPPLNTPFSTPSPTTSAFDSGPVLSTDSYRGNQSNFGSSASPASQSSAPNIRSGSSSDDFAAAWDSSSTNSNNNNNNRTGFGRTAENPSRPNTSRDTGFGTSSSFGTSNPQDLNRNTVAKQNDAWSDDSWSRNAQSPPSGAPVTIGSTSTPSIQSPTGMQPMNPPTVGTTVSNGNFGGQSQLSPPLPMTVNAGKPMQPSTANGEPQPWVTLLVVILSLAGSLAGNIYLGWSYLDARQKYQSLVRRTADTFRRSSQPVAA